MSRSSARPLLVVQPSVDYATHVQRHFPDAVLLATPERAVLLGHMSQVVAAPLEDFEATWQIAGKQHCGGIVCYVCDHLPLTAFLASRLGLPFHTEAAVCNTRDKSRAAVLWQAAGVPTPATRHIHDDKDLQGFMATSSPPWVLKPVDGTGSEWVLRADTPPQLVDAYQDLCHGLAADRDIPPEQVTCLAQQFIQGREFGADLHLLPDGGMEILRLTEKCLRPSVRTAGMVDAYYVAQVDTAPRNLIYDACLRGAAALGLGPGIAMADFILADGRPYLLEMAARPGGDCLPELCRTALGYDPVSTAARVALGRLPERGTGDARALAALHLMSERSGMVRSIDYRRLLAHPRVVGLIETYHGPGEELRCDTGSYDDRIVAACLVEYHDPEELSALSITLSALIDIELEPFTL